jgi:hypothetical protein
MLLAFAAGTNLCSGSFKLLSREKFQPCDDDDDVRR